MPYYTLSSLYPDRLRCDECGQHIGPVDLAVLDPTSLVSSTED
jgi:hypothetical protein